MTYWALVESNTVVGVAQAGDPADQGWLDWATGNYQYVVDVTALDPRPGIGWTYENGTFTPPPEPDPPAPEP